MSELTYGGLIFLALVILDFAYYIAMWVNRIPKVDGYTITPFDRRVLTTWGHHTEWFDVAVFINPIRFVDVSIKETDLAIEVEIRMGDKEEVPTKLRVWLDGTKYELGMLELKYDSTTRRRTINYSAIISQSDKFIKRHDPILETFG